MIWDFWTLRGKSNKTGTYSVQLRDQYTSTSQSPVYVTSYTITSSGVWQKVVLNIPAATLSSIVSTNTTGLAIMFICASGETPTYNPSIANAIGAWYNYSSNGLAVTNQANLFSSVSNYLRITDTSKR